MKARHALVSVTFFALFVGLIAVVYGQQPAKRLNKRQANRRALASMNDAIQGHVDRSNLPRVDAEIVIEPRNFINRPNVHKLSDDDANPLPWVVQVGTGLNLDPNTQTLYQQMATLINGYTQIPNDRLNYYSSVNDPPDWVISGWGGFVTNVQQINGGYLVTVSVSPQVSSSQDGPVAISTDYSEQYMITNNIVTYQDFLDPNGLAGQAPLLYSVN